MINYKLRGLIGKICFIYFEDLIIFGATPEEYIRNLQTIFDRLRDAHLMFNPDKSAFLQKRLEYLGHEITPDGIKPLEKNVEKLLTSPNPNQKMN